MSACGDFAEHVWKPGSCKNCFHPLSAHRRPAGRGLDGGPPAVCLTRTSLGGGDEEQGVTSPSPYSKPTIAVKPTMMMNSNEAVTDVNMNGGQDNQKSPVERLDLKKLLDLSPLYIDGCANGRRHALLQSAGTKTDCNNYYTPLPPAPSSPMGQPTPPKHSTTSSIFVFHEAGRTLNETGNGETFRQLNSSSTTASNRTTKSTYKGHGGMGLVKSPSREPCGTPAGIPLSMEIIPSGPAVVQNHRVNTVSPVSLPAAPSSTSPTSSSTSLTLDSFTHNASPSFPSPPSISEPASVSDSSCSYYSSTDSLPGPEGMPRGLKVSPEHPSRPLSQNGSQSSPTTPNGQMDAEPIYAESTKKKRRNQSNGTQSQTGAKQNHQAQKSPQSDQSPGDGQRATISVVAARTEANNRTFFLTSPDSAVSTQCHLSPTALKDPSSPAFCWPSPGHSPQSFGPLADPGGHGASLLHPKPQSSPPIPPKRSVRSPKLGASSLSPSFCSPVVLPELLCPRESPPKPGPESVGAGAAERSRHKPNHHGPAWSCRIVEEEEEEEGTKKEAAVKSGSSSRMVGMANTAAVWRDAGDHRAQGHLPLTPGQGTAPLPPQSPTSPNNGASQGQGEATAASAEGARHTGSMLAKASLLAASTELLLAVGRKPVSHEGNTAPPPPPPKKHHRACGRLNAGGGSMDQERPASQQGSVESLAPTLRGGGGLGSPTLPSASTDSLAADATGSRDTPRMACSSPFSRSPLTSDPGSPQPDPAPFGLARSTPPPLPEKKLVNRTASAPDSAGGKPFVRAYPRLPFSGSETNVCRPAAATDGAMGSTGSICRSSLPSSPVDPRSLMFSSSESLERCHAATAAARTSRSRTLDEAPPPLKGRVGGVGGGGRLGVHPRGSITCSSSPQLSGPLSAAEAGPGAGAGPGAAGSCMQLQTLLSNMDSREGVYSKLGGLYAESLRRLALKCEDYFTRSQRSPLRFDESNWSLFKLTCNRPSCSSGDAVYYSAACASDPANLYAVKICKSPSAEAKQGHLYGLSVQQSMRPHFNLQQDCGHFIACVPHSMLPPEEATPPPPTAGAVTPPPQGEQEQERVVVITREVPRHSAADFVRDWAAFHRAQPEAYERRVCFLLLQLCNGLEHLKDSGVTHRDLCLENLLLVPHHRPTPQASAPASGDDHHQQQRHLPRLLISNFAKAKRRSAEDAAAASADPRFKRDHARLAPEIVSAAQYRKFDEFQTGILIYELLHQPNPFEVSPALKEQDYRCQDLPPVPTLSLYSAGLHRLAQLLLQPDPIKRIHIQEAKRVLQSLLWGPRRDLMERPWDRTQAQAQIRPSGGGVGGPPGDGSRHEGLLNWLDVKRALLMMKFAERSLEPERNAELEDWLCCQYFSTAHPLSLCHTAELLYCLK